MKTSRLGALNYMEPSRARGVELTDADRALLAFAAEQRFVLVGQVALLLGVSDAAAAARLRRLGHAGCLLRARELHRGPTWHQITAAGLRAIHSELPPPRGFDLATHRHDAGLGWLMLTVRAGRFGGVRRVVSEREMRSADGRAAAVDPRYGVRLGGVGPGGREGLHYPDMVIVSDTGHRVAFELELSTKEPARRARILTGYAADPRIDAVVYLVDRPAAARAIDRSVRRLGLRELVSVQNVTLARGARAPRPGRTAAWAGGRGPAPEAAR